jgi:haloalkane dehalogenase
MEFIAPSSEELQYLRPDPLLWEQELDGWPELAEDLMRATGISAGKVYWRSKHDYVYALELAHVGGERPSMARIYGHWDRFEPRPPEHVINSDLLDCLLWVAEISDSLDPETVKSLAGHRDNTPFFSWPEGSVLRTPEERFKDLPDFPYEPQYVEVEGLRMAYVEHGSGDPILMLHGEPTWGFLYRRMIPPLATIARVVVPDLIGFGRSDKPALVNAYSYRSYVRWVSQFIEILDLKGITLVCQDWGGLIGLRILSQIPERFSRVVAMNTAIPAGEDMGDAFNAWRRFSQQAREFDVAAMMGQAVNRTLTDQEAGAYAAPFPSKAYQTAALIFPRLVPTRIDHPGAYDNRVAIKTLRELDLPVYLIFAEGERVTRPAETFLKDIFNNIEQSLTIDDAGHFIQEDAGEEVAEHIRRWIVEKEN